MPSGSRLTRKLENILEVSQSPSQALRVGGEVGYIGRASWVAGRNSTAGAVLQERRLDGCLDEACLEKKIRSEMLSKPGNV